MYLTINGIYFEIRRTITKWFALDSSERECSGNGMSCRHASSYVLVSSTTLKNRCCLAHLISHWTPIIQ